nr:unnamed protein product [Callosobruchus chinensis]
MNTFRRLQQLLGKSLDIYSEPGGTSHHTTFSRYIKSRKDLAWSIAHTFGELPPPLPCLYLMQSIEGQFDSSVTRPYFATYSRFLTGVLLVTSHSSTVIETDSAPLS